MRQPEEVFASFVEANPVPHAEVLHRERPDVEEILAELNETMPMARPTTSSPLSSRSRWLVAVAAVMLVVGLGTALRWIGNPAESAQADPADLIGQDAVAKAEQWLQAVNAGEISEVMSMSSPESSGIADRRVHEWVARLSAEGMPVQVGGCEVSAASPQDALVECEVRLTDLVAVELGVSQQVAPFRYSDGLLTWQPYTGGSISQVNAAYSTYLRQHHEADYETACAPSAYEPGSVVQDRGLALTGACAELAAPLANDVAQWIRGGRPSS